MIEVGYYTSIAATTNKFTPQHQRKLSFACTQIEIEWQKSMYDANRLHLLVVALGIFQHGWYIFPSVTYGFMRFLFYFSFFFCHSRPL